VPWCPKCVAEYRSEIETCPECGTTLIEEFPGLAEGVIPPRQREIALSLVMSLGLCCLSIAIAVGLMVASYMSRTPDTALDPMASVVPISGAAGLLAGRMRGGPMTSWALAVGWLLPWVVPYIVAIANHVKYAGFGYQQCSLPVAIVGWLAYAASAAFAGVVGTVLGTRWKQRRDSATLFKFVAITIILAVFWAMALGVIGTRSIS